MPQGSPAHADYADRPGPRDPRPEDGSADDGVERWFADLTTKKLRRGAHTSVPGLERDIREWIARWNEDPRRR